MKGIILKIIFCASLYGSLSSKTYGQYANTQDSLALVNLYNSTNGPGWLNRGGWLSTFVSGWYGVTLNSNGRVTGVSLPSNRLVGPLSSLNLPYLQTLNISSNQVSGNFPQLSMPDLQTLNINSNRFNGDFPNMVLDNLVTLTANFNSFTTLPALNMPLLQTLSFQANQLAGPLPNLTLPSLKVLNLAVNSLTGAIPSVNFSGLSSITLSANKFTSIPNFNLPALVTLDVSNNLLAGNVPDFNLPNLTLLGLSNNQLSGTVPDFNLPALKTLNLNGNQLSGTIPAWSFPALVTLNLYNNQFSGTMPNFNMPNLVNFYGYNNQFSGILPDFNMPHLTTLLLYNNQFSGAVPSLSSTALTMLDLNHNQFSSVVNLAKSINTINISYNQVMGNLTGLSLPGAGTLNLSHNLMSGTVADINVAGLQYLLLSHNQFEHYPDFNFLSSLRELRLSNNQLTGTPTNLSHLPNLWFLSLDTNDLSGSLPIFDTPPLFDLLLHKNHFSGTIPEEYVANGFGTLNLSNNLLKGPVPAIQIGDEQYYYIDSNFFTFDGLEEIVPQITPANDFIYAPQRMVSLHFNDNLLSLWAGGTLSNNTYKWYREAELIATTVGDSTLPMTDPGRYSVTVTNTAVPGLTLLSDTVTVLHVDLIDPSYSVVRNDGSIDPSLNGLDPNKTVVGAATDGVSKILLQASSKVPVSFHVDQASDGSFSDVGGTNYGPDITVTPGSDGKITAVYISPDGFGSTGSALERTMMVKATAGENGIIHIPVKLVTPPVVLVHGMWSDPAAWDDFKDYLKDNGFEYIGCANYSKNSMRTFDPGNAESAFGRNAIRMQVNKQLSRYRNELKVSAAQVDVVAHSLGGLMSRSLSQEFSFKKEENYFKGRYHKLITIGTPHRGSPLGPELWKHRSELLYYRATLNGKKPVTVEEAMAARGMPLGSCHPAFGKASAALYNLDETLPFKTFSITADYTGQNFAHGAINELCKTVLQKDLSAIMGSVCQNGELTHDLIVPLSSQKGFTTNGKFALFTNTCHFEKNLPGWNSETSSEAIQQQVKNLLLSREPTDFGIGYPAPLSLPEDCTSQLERFTQDTVQQVQRVPTTEQIHITSPASGAVYQDGSAAQVTVTFEALGGARPVAGLFLVDKIGWFPIPSTAPYTVNFNLPAGSLVGKIGITAIVLDSAGFRLADTLSIIINPAGTLDSMIADPDLILLDSTSREASLFIRGFFSNGSTVRVADITSATAGTTYTMDHATIAIVDGEGVVRALSTGTDTITITNGTHTLRIPVVVDGNFAGATYAGNEIDFALITDKAVTDSAFSLEATASSGEEVSYEILSGPATVENGIVSLTGQPGTVTVRASAAGNAYFSAALPVSRSFNVLAVQTYTFTGNGNWDDAANWEGGLIPPAHLQNGGFIYIDPLPNGECILNIQQTIDSPGKLVVRAGKTLRITGDLLIGP